MAKTCKIEYNTIGTYILIVVSCIVTITLIRLFHEFMHGFYSILTGGEFGLITVIQWILFYPVFGISCSGGNPFMVIEGTLITVFLVATLITILTSFSFLRTVIDPCRATNLSGKLFGVGIGSAFEMIGTGVYALPNFMFYLGEGTIFGGDGTHMAMLFESIGYSPQLQYIIAFSMMIAGIFVLFWYISCSPMICGKCSVNYTGA